VKKRQIVALASVLLVGGVVVSASSSAAKSTKTQVDFWEVGCVLDPGTSWISEDGVFHGRGRVATGVFYDADDFARVGTDTVVGNANLDPVTGTGRLFGTFSLEYLPDSYPGTFDGTWNSSLAGWVSSFGRAVGQGTGELHGMKMKLKLVGDPTVEIPDGLLAAVAADPEFPCALDEISGIGRDTGFIHSPRGD